MEQILKGIRIGNNINEQVAEDPNENNQDHDEQNSSSEIPNSNKEDKKRDSNNSYVVNVHMNQRQDTSTLNVNINLDDNSSSRRDDHTKRSVEEEKDPSQEQDKNEEKKKEEEVKERDEEDDSEEEPEIQPEIDLKDDRCSSQESEDERDRQSEPFVAHSQTQSQFDDILAYYEILREKYNSTKQWEDHEFGDDPTLFSKTGELDEKFTQDYKIEFNRVNFEDDNNNFFTFETTSHNINYEFKIKRGLLNDKFFLGAFLMLFRRREEFFTNLILDYEHIKENINAGFCGFTFFINGEWKNITVDTRIPYHQNDEASLSTTESKNSFWMCLLEKAYSKAFKTYDILNGTLVNDYLVDLTGGWSRMKIIDKDKIKDDASKKALFEEIGRCINQKYLIGCMKFNESEITDELEASRSDDGGDEQQIATNCMYNIYDTNTDPTLNNKVLYLVNHWPKGKYTGNYSPEDETWEANKSMAERFNYQVSQSDGTFWMGLEEWIQNFDRLYLCRIFPESWTQFYVSGQWSTVTSGGATPKNIPWTPEIVANEKLGGFKGDKTVNIATPSMVTSVQKKKTTVITGAATQSFAHFQQTPAIKSGIQPDTDMFLKSNQQFAGSTTFNRQAKMMFTPSAKKDTFGRSGLEMSKSNMINTINASATLKPPVEIEKKPPKKKKESVVVKKELVKRVVITDTEDRWFLNPQYKLELGIGTKLIISLIQEDKKLQDNTYLKCCFLLLYSKGKYTRVWDLDEEMIIKKAQDDEEGVSNREIIIQLDYHEALKCINENRKKKLPKGEKIHINLIPFIDYNTKYEIEKKGMIGTFKTYAIEAVFWLRVFSSTPLYFMELPPPYECTLANQWIKDQTAGGARFLTEKGRTFENSKWAMNPQFIMTFDSNIQMKIIIKKTTGYYSNKDNKIGFMLTKPEVEDTEALNMKQKTKNNFAKTFSEGSTMVNKLKTDQISRVINTTMYILDKKKTTLEDIYPKLFINSSEWIVESSYSNSYCASIYKQFKKIDSPIIIIPTLDNPDIPFEYEIKVYSNRKAYLYPLNNDGCKLLMGEWKEGKCGGCHISQNEKKFSRKPDSDIGKSNLTWYDNPKFNLAFDSKEKIPFIEFEIVLSRCESIWKPIIAKGVVNSMIGIYLFHYDLAKWKERCINIKEIDFLPKNEVKIKFEFEDLDPRGVIIMPVTYGRDIKGPFVIMVKCRNKFFLTKMDDNFN